MIIPKLEGGGGEGDAEFKYNETEAKRLGLERVELEGFPQADVLIQEVINKTIDITSAMGRMVFVRRWRETCPNLPMPCVPDKDRDFAKGDYWCLERLSQNRIVSSLSDNAKTVKPNFDAKETMLVDSSFPEVDYDAVDDNGQKILQTVISLLLREFIPNKIAVVNIKRETIDSALWEGDPSNRKPSAKHIEVLTKLGFDPSEWEIHCPRQEQMARASASESKSVVKNYGTKNLYSILDDYFLGGDGERFGLNGGRRGNGGCLQGGQQLARQCQ